MLFSKQLVETANWIQGLSEDMKENVINEAIAKDYPKLDVLELLLDQTIRDRVLNR